jgi:pimeloyl-ACP methyl ester carboxylesterase
LAIGFASYVRPFKADGDSALLAQDETVRVERRTYGIVFLPQSGASSLGFIFYPGAKVPPEAYAYLGRATARAGYASVIVSFPFNFAVLASKRALSVMKDFPSVKSWVLGGHSLGGAMAAAFCEKAPASVAGLLLLAAYPGGGTDLSSSKLPVVCLSASNDGLATPGKVSAARRLLPPETRYVELSGGSHAQFGQYGLQPGDGTATIPAAVQRQAVVEEAVGLMDRVFASLR